MQRNCRFEPLAAQPLILVLGQVRFSPVRQLRKYIPAIQEEFRRSGFPIERAGNVKQLAFGPGGGPPQFSEEQRWEYRSKDERQSILVMEDSIVLQATAYERFERFAEVFGSALYTVLKHTENDQFGVIQRIGLRYIDVVRPSPEESFRDYLRSGFHGPQDGVYKEGTQRLFVESVGRTTLAGSDGTMILRVAQSDSGSPLPPDLVASAPKHEPRSAPGEVITLIDMDHFTEGTFEADSSWAMGAAYELHDHLIDVFHEHVVSEHAIKVWK